MGQNVSLTKGKLYSNKDETIIYRLIAFVEDTNRLFVVNCYTKKTSYIDESELYFFNEISEEHMLYKVGIEEFPKFETLSNEQKKIAMDNYNLISSFLMNSENAYLRHEKMEDISKIYKISKRRLERLLGTYLAYGRVESLVNLQKQTSISLKPALREVEYRGEELPGFALLTQFKLRKGMTLYLLVDSYCKYIYSFSIGNYGKEYSAIKSLIMRGNYNNGSIPSSINANISKETWCTHFRNLQCLGIDIQFGHHKNNRLHFLHNLVNRIYYFVRKEPNIDKINAFVKEEINLYNVETPQNVFYDVKQVFRDSFIFAEDKNLIKVLNKPYRAYFDKI